MSKYTPEEIEAKATAVLKGLANDDSSFLDPMACQMVIIQTALRTGLSPDQVLARLITLAANHPEYNYTENAHGN